jgi:hypothetical protein
MNKLFGNLIILSPGSRIIKFRFTPRAFVVLALSCAISFGAVVAIGYSFPKVVSEREHLRLERENQELRISNMNAALGAARVAEQTQRMEEQSRRIQELIDTE